MKGTVVGIMAFFLAILTYFLSEHRAWAEPPGNTTQPAPLVSQSPSSPSPVSSRISAQNDTPPLSLNGPDALSVYKHSWNPLTAGPNLVSYADTLPEGVFNARFFFYSRFTQAQYTNSGGITGLPPGFYETQMLALEAMYFGLGSNTELAILPSLIGTDSSIGGASINGWGMNDFTIGIKHRWIIQNPDSARPSFSTFLFTTLPTTAWLGTPVPKGGLPPISVLPATHFGSPSLTGTLLLRKNIRPLRFYGGLYYTYSFPGIESLTAADPKFFAQFGDLIQYRMAVEDVIDDKHGLGLILEMVGLSELPFSVDGLPVNTTPKNFNLISMQPTIEVNLTPKLALSVGVLFPVWGNNEYLAMTPNFSLWYYFGSGTLQR
uniref:ORF376 n=2 Tax=Leptospirillum ferrooxidans TaxID=180 RepID=Q58KB4_9BACT|nr:ORF376 [Leptospirillum ferrooxidans]